MIDHTVLGFEIFRRLFPFKPTEDELKRYPRLQDTYKPFAVLEVLPFFALAGGAGYLWYHAFLALEARHIERLGLSVALIVPTVYYWMLLSLFLGIISSAPLLHLFYKSLLRGRYADYVLYNNMRAGFDTWKLVRGLAVLTVIPALGFALLGMDTYNESDGQRGGGEPLLELPRAAISLLFREGRQVGVPLQGNERQGSGAAAFRRRFQRRHQMDHPGLAEGDRTGAGREACGIHRDTERENGAVCRVG